MAQHLSSDCHPVNLRWPLDNTPYPCQPQVVLDRQLLAQAGGAVRLLDTAVGNLADELGARYLRCGRPRNGCPISRRQAFLPRRSVQGGVRASPWRRRRSSSGWSGATPVARRTPRGSSHASPLVFGDSHGPGRYLDPPDRESVLERDCGRGRLGSRGPASCVSTSRVWMVMRRSARPHDGKCAVCGSRICAGAGLRASFVGSGAVPVDPSA